MKKRHVSDQRKNVSMDFIPAALRGTVLGAVAGLLLGLVASWIPGFNLHGLGVLALGGVGALIGTWASVLVGASLPDEVRRTFEHEIEQGRILVVVDGEPGLLEQVDPAVARAGGVRLPYEATTALT